MTETAIEWTHWPGRKGMTWNPWPWIGCTKISPGCVNCYEYRVAKTFGHTGEFDPEALKLTHKLHYPSTVKEPAAFFVNSMYDTFHHGIPDSSRDVIFTEMENNPRHIFLNLTKRPMQMKEYVKAHYVQQNKPPPDNVWLGVSVENRDYLWRIEVLNGTQAAHRFISFEPLLGSLSAPDLDWVGLTQVDWILVGGESDYQNPRPMKPEWALTIRDHCRDHDIPFFFKQQGGRTKCQCHGSWGCALLDGQLYREYPGK